MFRSLVMGAAAATFTLGTPAVGQNVEIQEWEVPWEESRPRDPYVAPDGKVWFVGQRTDYAAYLDPATGEFQRFDLPAGAGPHNLIVDEDGIVWYAGNRAAHIGRLDPATGDIVQYPMPEADARDPHTLVFNSAGEIWFTLQGANMIGHFDRTSGEVRLARVPTQQARPYGIKIDAEDRPWIVLFGTNKLATVDPATMALREIALPRADARPRRLEITPDGRIWYVDYRGGYLGAYTPATESFEEWALPGGAASRPYATALDGHGRIWLVESGLRPNQFVGFDPATGQFFGRTAIPSGGGTVRHMYYHAPSGSIWFGTDTNYIGRAVVDGPRPMQ